MDCSPPGSIGFPRQEFWSMLPFPSPGDLPNPGIKSVSPALTDGFFTTELWGKPDFLWWFQVKHKKWGKKRLQVFHYSKTNREISPNYSTVDKDLWRYGWRGEDSIAGQSNECLWFSQEATLTSPKLPFGMNQAPLVPPEVHVGTKEKVTALVSNQTTRQC